jgi:hypothetical protein
MILADSIRQTASIARCVSVAFTATHHIIFDLPAQLHHASLRCQRQLYAAATLRTAGPNRFRSIGHCYLWVSQPSGPNSWRISVSPSQPGQYLL